MKCFEPTEPQRASLEALMPRSPSDVASRPPARHAVIRWPTGSGKTLAYALPMLARVDVQRCGHGLQALVLTPTRELALQTLHTLQKLVGYGKTNKKGHSIHVVPLLGDPERLAKSLAKAPPDVAIGTPHTVGALLDHELLPLCEDPAARTLVVDEVGAFFEPFRWAELERVLASKGGRSGSSPYRVWSRGALWVVAAEVPEGLPERCLQVARATVDEAVVARLPIKPRTASVDPSPPPSASLSDSAGDGPRTPAAVAGLARLEAAELLPPGIRHVALCRADGAAPLTPLASLSATITELVAWRRPLARASDGDKSQAAAPWEGDGLTAAADTAVAEVDAAAAEAAAAAAAEGGGVTPAVSAAAEEDCDGERSAAWMASTASEGEEPSAQHAAAGVASKAPSARAIVFVDSAEQAEALRRAVKKNRVDVVQVHGGDGTSRSPRSARERALRYFAEGRSRVLVATEMLSYGVDVRGASHVVNGSVPKSDAAYLRRAGRVGRVGGAPGTVISLPRTRAELGRLRGFARRLGFELEEMESLTEDVKDHALRRESYAKLTQRVRRKAQLQKEARERMRLGLDPGR